MEKMDQLLHFLQGENPGLFITELNTMYARMVNVETATNALQEQNKKKRDLYLLPQIMEVETIAEGTKRIKVCRTNTEAVRAVQFVFADLDILDKEKVRKEKKDTLMLECMKVTLERLEKSQLPSPNLVTYTGRGTHVIYRIQPSKNKELFREVQKELARKLSGDAAVSNPNRALRFPGSINTKYMIETEVILFEPDKIYTLEDLAQILGVEKNKKLEEPYLPPVQIMSADFSQDTLDRVVELINPIYRKGYRHRTMFYLTGLMLKEGLGKNSIDYVFQKLTVDDEEREQRYVQAVKYQIEKAEKEGVQRMSGSKGLQEVIAEQLITQGKNEEEAKMWARKRVQEVVQIIRENMQEKFSLSPDLAIVIKPTGTYIEYWRTVNGKKEKIEEPITPYTIKVVHFDEKWITISIVNPTRAEARIERISRQNIENELKSIIPARDYTLLNCYILGIVMKSEEE